MKIYAPNKNATGTWCGTRFINGVGESNDPYIIKWFKDHGYKVEDGKPIEINLQPTEIVEKEVKSEVAEPDFEAMTPNELRDWLRTHGYGSKIKNIRNKEKLLELVRG
jgi:hypothetical protein